MLLMILLLSGSHLALSQNDSICYARAQAIKIATDLLEGKKCENSLKQSRLSYSDCTEQLNVQGVEFSKVIDKNTELEKSIQEKEIEIDRLEQKIKRKNKVITVLVITGIIETFLLIVK